MLDLEDDFELFDGIENVTLQVRDSNGTVVEEVEDVRALARAVGFKVLKTFAYLDLSAKDTVFHLSVASCGGVTVNENCTILREDGTIWNVMDSLLATLKTRWQCPCREWKQ